MKIPLFDLDGTLLQRMGGKPHDDSFNFALRTVYSLYDAAVDEIVTDGMIDPQILIEIVKLHGINEEDSVAKLPQAMKAMVNYFQIHKDEQHALPHKGAKEILKILREKVNCGVLTGNIEEIGWEKLRQAGLKDYISFGSFGNMALKRVDLILIAQEIYNEKFKENRPLTDFVIIGDTPKDIFCAKDGGISAIAVATGNFTFEELSKENPDLVLQSLEEKEKIIEFLQA